jgi:hypothetical protein
MDDEFFCYAKTHYFAEIERRKELTSSVTTSFGVASLMGAGIYGLAYKLPIISDWVGAIAYAGLSLASIALTVAVYCLVRSHVGHAYKYTAWIGGIVSSRETAVQRGYSNQQLASATKLLIGEQYVESVGFNELVNEAKSGWLHRANKALVMTLAIVFAVGVLTVVSHATAQVNESMTHGSGSGQQSKQSGASRSANTSAGSPANARNQGKRNS